MLGETSIADSQKASFLIQFLISTFQPMGRSHATDWLHHSRNTCSALRMFSE